MNIIDYKEIIKKYDAPCYICDISKLKENIKKLTSEFRKYYSNYSIAYSYKTNYLPSICKVVKEMGGYAEIVSDMEYLLAKKIGYSEEKIIYNGPCKGKDLENFILKKGIVIVDNLEELNRIIKLVNNKRDNIFEIGVRLNFSGELGKNSRFGFYYEGNELKECLKRVREVNNLKIVGIHCHITGARDLVSWERRIKLMLDMADKNIEEIKFIDLGSGMYGEMDEILKEQFGSEIPTFYEYASVVAKVMNEHYFSKKIKPLLLTEPGTTLVANTFSFVGKITSIKEINHQAYAIMNCSYHNLGELSTKKQLPIKVIGEEGKNYKNLIFSGYTCLEYDIFYKNYSGNLKVGNYVVFENIGSYSNNLKPPFIWPNCKILIYDSQTQKITLGKKDETFEDLFLTYIF